MQCIEELIININIERLSIIFEHAKPIRVFKRNV